MYSAYIQSTFSVDDEPCGPGGYGRIAAAPQPPHYIHTLLHSVLTTYYVACVCTRHARPHTDGWPDRTHIHKAMLCSFKPVERAQAGRVSTRTRATESAVPDPANPETGDQSRRAVLAKGATDLLGIYWVAWLGTCVMVDTEYMQQRLK